HAPLRLRRNVQLALYRMEPQSRRRLVCALPQADEDRSQCRSARSCFVTLLFEIEARELHVSGLGDFDVALGAEDDVNVVADALDETGFVGSADAIGLSARESFLDELCCKRLRRLRQHYALTRNGPDDQRNILRQTGAL